jgi:hypothetical protein
MNDSFKKYLGLFLILILVLNIFMAAFRVYTFLTFWIVLIVVIVIGYSLGLIKKS